MLDKLAEVVAQRAAQIVLRKLLKEGGADMVLSAVGQQAAYNFLKKHGWAVVDGELFLEELDRQMAPSVHTNNMGARPN